LNRPTSVQPDFFAIIDRQKVRWAPKGSPLNKSSDLSTAPFVAQILEGQRVVDQILVMKGNAYQLTAIPIDDGRGQIYGGIVIGIDITRYMQQYKEQSDEREKMQHRLTLVHKGEVVASVMPKKIWAPLGESLKTENWGKEPEGENFLRPVINLEGAKYDFYRGEVFGFADAVSGQIGNLFLLRSRRNLKGRGAVIPWGQILVGAILSVLIASLLAMWITRPIKSFVKQSRELLAGGADLSQRIKVTTRDETSDLAHNINHVFDRLHGLASEVQNAAFQVGASSAQISAASKHMLDGLKDQTFKIESSTAAVTELSASIQQVASNAAQATTSAESSNVAVTSAVERMQQIRHSVEDAAGKMADLGESSKRIGNIVEVIRQISEQTSLLALNASIEAAHAGEQGRGFAVVADEVSSLARRVGQSAKDIESLIQTIKEQTSEAVSSMDRGASDVESGTELVTATLQDLQNLISVIRDTANAVQEQAVVSDEIARNMDAVQKIAGEMVAGSEEAVQQGEQLHGLAYALEQAAGGFNLGEHDGGAADPQRTLKA
jgi:methyl-accepting chemotaxis protein